MHAVRMDLFRHWDPQEGMKRNPLISILVLLIPKHPQTLISRFLLQICHSRFLLRHARPYKTGLTTGFGSAGSPSATGCRDS